MNGPTIALAVSGHGYGHAVRCAEVARALLARGARVVVRTDAPRWLFPPGAEHLPAQAWPLDIGVEQTDGLELNVDETRRLWRHFARLLDQRAEVEAGILKASGVDIVVGDIPPLAFAAASRAGKPSYALSNFTWDWIYSVWPDFADIVTRIRSEYSAANTFLRLPLHGGCSEAFSHIEDVPLIARRASRGRDEVRRELGLAPEARVVLLSFGGFTARGLNLNALSDWKDYVFVVTPPIAQSANDVPANVVTLNETPPDYVSLLAACDVVITKPGYGIVADCLANRVSVLFTNRGPFREYDVLAAALPRLGRARYVPREALLDGCIGPHLDVLLETTTPWTEQPMNGAEVVAERIVSARYD
jgi:UDP:flavonoid glycosyltransferase YjiC (YdhE family)